jgi:uncharacterized protein
MLVSFTVENFRSLREKATLSALTKTRRTTPIATAPLTEWDVELLPVLALGGDPGSGKSNLLTALDNFLEYMVSGDLMKGEVQFKFVPFRLDTESAQRPTYFAIWVARGEVLYHYELALTQNRIVYEHLAYVPAHTQTPRILFHRDWDETQYHWQFGADFAGAHTHLSLGLKEYEPFISMLVRQKIKILEPLARWLWLRWAGLGVNATFDRQMAARLGHGAPEGQERALELLNRFHINVVEVEIQKVDPRTGASAEEFQIYMWRDTPTGRVRWPLEEESVSTQRLFGLVYRLLYGFTCQTLTLFDDLGSGLPPAIARDIVSLFQDPATNPHGAQLIFASGDTRLLKDKLLGKDQGWIMSSQPDGNTELISQSRKRPVLKLGTPIRPTLPSLPMDDA